MVTTPESNNPYSIHPDCPDFRMLGGQTEGEAALRALGDAVARDDRERDAMWAREGFTRRALLTGGLGVGVAALAAQLTTARVSYGSPAEMAANGNRSLVVVFLRGGLDGLSVLVPAEDKDLLASRPNIAIRGGSLIPFDRNFGLHPALSALKPMLDAGKIAAVPDIATPELSRSHFQAQDCLERGGTSAGGNTGWLDRVLEQAGAGTTFRSVSATQNLTRSLIGTQNSLVARRLSDLKIHANDNLRDKTRAAIEQLYTGIEHPFTVQAGIALDADAQAAAINAANNDDPRGYPEGGFPSDLRTLATLIKSEVGMRLATVDLGGWDMHSGIGDVDQGNMRDALQKLGDSLAAFFADLGPKADSTTVILMSEFGRRAEQNGSGGTDHGHGGLAMAIGGGVRGGVYGTWNGVSENALVYGDLPGHNDFRDFLGEVVMSTMGLTEGQLANVFPNWKVSTSGMMVPA